MIYSNSLQGIALASTAFAKICTCPLFLSLFIIMYSSLWNHCSQGGLPMYAFHVFQTQVIDTKRSIKTNVIDNANSRRLTILNFGNGSFHCDELIKDS